MSTKIIASFIRDYYDTGEFNIRVSNLKDPLNSMLIVRRDIRRSRASLISAMYARMNSLGVNNPAALKDTLQKIDMDIKEALKKNGFKYNESQPVTCLYDCDTNDYEILKYPLEILPIKK